MPYEIKQVAEFISQTMVMPIWHDDGLLKLYLYCLSRASHNAYNWRGLLIQPGDLPLSERNTAATLSWSRDKLSRKIKQLSGTGLITIHSIPFKGSMIHITDWHQNNASLPQSGITTSPIQPQNQASFLIGPSNSWPDNQSSFQSASGEIRPVFPQKQASYDETGLTTRPNPIVEKNNNSSIISGQSEPDGFTEIWISYPVSRRFRRAEAALLVRRAFADGATIEAILEALEEEKRSDAWQKENGRFIPGIVTWLQKEAWRSYVQPTEPKEDEELWTTR